MQSDQLQGIMLMKVSTLDRSPGKRVRTFSSLRASRPSSSFLASPHLRLCSKKASLLSLLTPCGWKPAWYGSFPRRFVWPPASWMICATGPFSGERVRMYGAGVPAAGKGEWPGGTVEKGNVDGGGVPREPGGGERLEEGC